MKNMNKVIILSILIIILMVVAQPISLSNTNVGIAVSGLIFIMMGVIISELSGLIGSKVSKLFLKLFGKKSKE